MAHLGSIEGIGRLIFESADLGEVRYSIRVYRRGQFKPKTANGHLETPIDIGLAPLIASAQSILKLEDGGEVTINIKSITDGRAAFNVTGSVPGF